MKKYYLLVGLALLASQLNASSSSVNLVIEEKNNIENSEKKQEWSECGICFEENIGKSENLVTLKCGETHLFHPGCLYSWGGQLQANSNKCPICRAPFSGNDRRYSLFKYVKKYAIKYDQRKKRKIRYNYFQNRTLLKNLIRALNCGADVNAVNQKGGNTILMFASLCGHTQGVKSLLAKEAINVNAINKQGDTALSFASQKGYADIVQLLLDKENINVNSANTQGNTPLIHAANNGHANVVELLLDEEDIDVNSANKKGDTALIHAANSGFANVVQLLLEKEGRDVNVTNTKGNTALIHAAFNGHTNVAQVLLAKEDVDVNVTNTNGNTALILACKMGHSSIVELLLEREDINIDAANRYDNTALMLASLKSFNNIVEMLEAKIAQKEKIAQKK